ncbi:hypothetical protein LCGC14_2393730 [marine sediment metagenome]|uniref:Uncharacterized protein n=1 Tax=marine sediment metagenome TaxID=412755 RepID=A0A0F9BXE0_9ZZZZ
MKEATQCDGCSNTSARRVKATYADGTQGWGNFCWTCTDASCNYRVDVLPSQDAEKTLENAAQRLLDAVDALFHNPKGIGEDEGLEVMLARNCVGIALNLDHWAEKQATHE